ncbi:MAG: CopY/TcrY family copper transport repressor [Streptococcaceae bacterium]|jgi:CopY/TcrY family copper transport repressor|nr:CopY/TcrY family copper transport repressor [Streptococcaceae bacterium]
MELNVSNAEMVVMRVIWSLGSAKVEDVVRQVADRQDWSLATIKTLLGRLVKKGMLTTTKEGRCFIYQPTVEECDALQSMTQELLDKVCATKQVQLLEDMVTASKLTAADVSRLVEKLSSKETLESIECTCLTKFGHGDCKHMHEDALLAVVK